MPLGLSDSPISYQLQFKPAHRRMFTLRENMLFCEKNGLAALNWNPYHIQCSIVRKTAATAMHIHPAKGTL
jgi:hypothetical protein